jgi:polyribonucleotide nucleotidyltransferase
MDGGVPIKAPVAGISAGLRVDEQDPDKYLIFMDIQGIEDFFGDMDFKVAGTKSGITAIQMDIKVPGLSYDIIRDAFELTRKGRLKIIDEVILETLPTYRENISKYAPKILTMSIDPDKIRDVIGPGGKVINKIIAETGVKIDIEDDGKVYVATVDLEAGQKAMSIIEGITRELTPGLVFDGTVTRIMNFGAFVEFLPGKEGLVHISKLSNKRVNKVEDVVNIGDSRAYYITLRGITQVTNDHSVIEEMIARGDITRAEAWKHPSKHLITRALGTLVDEEPDVFYLDLYRGDYILLCSDGLTNLVMDSEILFQLQSGVSVRESCEKLVEMALTRGAPDNVTVVLFKK